MSSTDSVGKDCFSDERSVITVGGATGAVIAGEDVTPEAVAEAAVFAAWRRAQSSLGHNGGAGEEVVEGRREQRREVEGLSGGNQGVQWYS